MGKIDNEIELKFNIKKFYWFSFLSEWVFWVPVIVLFWQANGLSLTEIMILQSLFAISIVLLEVPTGVVADKVGRKQSLVWGSLFMVIGFTTYFLGHSFWQFVGAEFILAIGGSFISGANSAFVYDSLKQTKEEKNFKKVWGNAKSLGYLAAAITSILGGFIAIYSLRLTWVPSILGMIILFFVALSFREPRHYKRVAQSKSYLRHTRESFKEVFANKNLFFLLLFYSILTVVARVSLWFYQPYMSQSGLPIAYFGVIWASFNVFAIWGSSSANKLENKLGERWSLWFMIIGMFLSLVFMSYWFALFGVVFIFLQQFIRGFSSPVLQDYTHKHLSSEKRATLLSIQNMAASLMFAILAPLYGFFADRYSLSAALLIVAISSFMAFSLLMIWNKKRNG